ncbi:Alpha/beta hydrolase family protein [Rhodobacteraceae bacterium THAF1]|uniref:alpha/beta hydrolase family protein n=1 Tax=Palleronia sp. THAF1 TaxID=2587842 RepID=UPI000F3DB312|nr:dienelactone hydrolase [Palleronia sp. THAF1]QFU09603.1 Alpha/beta hydrolase family protein [Palleronia sp. THAF1]VDC17496.1 Alpha/beta hydrolase family protein [Rhodobacteraceae bacterium THAF1]
MKHATIFAAGLMALPAVAQDNPIDRIRPDAPELAAYGDHTIGVRTLTLTRPDVVDVVNSTEGEMVRYDRDITVEVFYPAADGTEPGGTYTAFLRDGETEVQLSGRAARDADVADGTFPLVLISHGYPGNRFLMTHLGENIASKGYVAVSIDHPDSTYSDMGAFASTLYNRPQDQSFVLDAMASQEGDLGGIIDASRTGLIGYSMGGYGALIFSGAGIEADGDWPDRYNPPGAILQELAVGADRLAEIQDDRLAAVIAIGPWGRNRDFWSEEGLGQIDLPLMLVAGSVDDVSEYPAIRQIFVETSGTTRHLLSFGDANHNAAAPMPAPQEAWEVEGIYGHYADAVWDTTRMNNILQHFTTAFLDLHLKGQEDRGAYLDLVEVSDDGVYDVAEDGTESDEHTYWEGFPNRTAKGLRFETLTP